MNRFRADLHIHTVLSPCGDLEMSPLNIVKKACEQALDIIGITDHNSTLHCKLVREIAQKEGIFALSGAEVTTKEEVHCLAFFENDELLDEFQNYLGQYLPQIPNDPDRFGYQVVVNEAEEIISHEPWLLINAIDQSLDQVENEVHRLGGLFIPAHIDKSRFSLISQLGFIPKGIKADAFEISGYADERSITQLLKGQKQQKCIRNSDAHQLDEIGKSVTLFEMENRSFQHVREALLSESFTTIVK